MDEHVQANHPNICRAAEALGLRGHPVTALELRVDVDMHTRVLIERLVTEDELVAVGKALAGQRHLCQPALPYLCHVCGKANT